MTLGLIYLEAAAVDLEDISDFIIEQSGSVDTAEALVGRLKRRCDRLAELSGILGQLRNALAPGLRSTPEGRYVIFFRYVSDRIEIVNILHSARDLEAMFEAARD